MQDGQIFNTLVAFFEADDWKFQWLEGLSVLSMPFTGQNGRWMCYAQAREEQHQFVFYSVCPVSVPEERRIATMEFTTRANYGMIIGNFEMDIEDGEVRYKTSLDVEGDDLTAPLIRQVVYANLLILDRYLPGLMRVIYGNMPAQEAITLIEDPDEDADNDNDNDTSSTKHNPPTDPTPPDNINLN